MGPCVYPQSKMLKRKTYRKKRFPRRKGKGKTAYRRKGVRGNSRRKILEITSVKKRDTMRIATFNGTNYTAASDIRGVRVTLPGASNNFYSGIWCPTYRMYDSTDKVATARNARNVYWKGLSEKIRIEAGSQAPIEFRRIVFSTPDRILLSSSASSSDQPSIGVEPSTNRYWRTTGDGAMNLDYLGGVFEGSRTLDWLNPMTAKTDTKRIKVYSDKRYKISSGTTSPGVKEMKFYDGFNKSMTYDDDEVGGLMATNGWAEYSRFGTQQNVYVLVLMMGVGNNATAQDSNAWIDYESTVYWHER